MVRGGVREPDFVLRQRGFAEAIATLIQNCAAYGAKQISKLRLHGNRIAAQQLEEDLLHRVFRRGKIQPAAAGVGSQRCAMLLIQRPDCLRCEPLRFQGTRPDRLFSLVMTHESSVFV